MRSSLFTFLIVSSLTLAACGPCAPDDLTCIIDAPISSSAATVDPEDSGDSEETGEPVDPPEPLPLDACTKAYWDSFAVCHIVLFPGNGLYSGPCYTASTAELLACPDKAIEEPGEDGADSCWHMASMWGDWTWCEGQQWVCKVDPLQPEDGPVCADTCGQVWLSDSEPQPSPCP